MTRYMLAAVALGSIAALMQPSAASAEDGFTVSDVNMRAGPASRFPVIGTLPGGARVYIHGCLGEWDWCDVSWGDERGWVFSDYLESLYGQRRVPLVEYRARLNIPVLTFNITTYWDRYYRDRYWYRDRDHWARGDWNRDRDWSQGDNDRDRDRDWSKDNDRDRDWSRGDNDQDRRLGNRNDRDNDPAIGSGDRKKWGDDRNNQAQERPRGDRNWMRDKDDDRTGSIKLQNDDAIPGRQTTQQRGNQHRTGQDCDPTDQNCERD
jgi:uncharacterized protein YraI